MLFLYSHKMAIPLERPSQGRTSHRIDALWAPDEVQHGVPLRLSARAIVGTMLAGYGVLLTMHLIVVLCIQLGLTQGLLPRLYARFYFDGEANLPAYLSAVNLLVAACLLGVIASQKRAAGDAWARHWKVLAVLFLALSIDESCSLHEMVVKPLRSVVNLNGYLAFAWGPVGLVVASAIGIAYFRFLMGLSRPLRIGFIAAAGMFLCGTIGMEMIGGRLAHDDHFGRTSLAYMAAVTIEESLEMLGIVLFNSILLNYLSGRSTSVELAAPPAARSR